MPLQYKELGKKAMLACGLLQLRSRMLGDATVTNSDANTQVLVDEIKRYLMANPHAADTLEGVMNWWLMGAARTCSKEDVYLALQQLESDGVVKRQKITGGDYLYSAMKD
jgi:hypothetical protein